MDWSALVGAVDRLYETVMSDPSGWDEDSAASWLGEVAFLVTEPDRAVARELRRAARAGLKLGRYWADPQRSRPPADWRSAVDQALGGKGWQPGLQLARLGLAAAPGPELFAEVKARFRVAHFGVWMEGVDFDTWLAEHHSPSGTADGGAR